MAGKFVRSMLAAAALASAPFLCGTTGLTNNLEGRVLAAHNRERSAVGVPPLRWNPALAASARRWADHLAATGRFEHAPADVMGEEGENLWAGTRGYYSIDAMVDGWVREKRYFRRGIFPDNSTTGDDEDVGHYTQLIWRDTGDVGCAIATGRVEDVMVCRYSDAGNWMGQSPL